VVGGQQCNTLQSNTTQLLCNIGNLANAQQWDVLLPFVVYDLQRMVQSEPFMGVQMSITRPYIANLSGCQGSGLSLSACDVDDDVITLSGSGFSASTTCSSLSSAAPWQPMLTTTRHPVVLLLSDGQLVLPLSTLSDPIRAAIGSRGNQSIAFFLVSVDILSNLVSIGFAPIRLNVSAVIGCSQSLRAGMMAVTDCYATSVLAMRGLNLYTLVSVSVAGGACLVTSQQSTDILCTLSVPDGYHSGTAYDLVYRPRLITSWLLRELCRSLSAERILSQVSLLSCAGTLRLQQRWPCVALLCGRCADHHRLAVLFECSQRLHQCRQASGRILQSCAATPQSSPAAS
jgi:hypothetical protein